MDQVKKDIIDYLVRNRVSTSEVSDCLEKTGVVSGVKACNQGYYRAGEIKWVYAYNESNWMLHKQIQDITENRIVFVDCLNCGERALFGELVSKYLLLYRQEIGIVVNGKIRDAAAIIREKWPMWCEGYTPIGCFNTEPEKPVDIGWVESRRKIYDGAIAVCDDSGVVVIPKARISFDFLEELKHIEDQEDIWFDRLNHHKESTFNIVCERTYLMDDAYMSSRENRG